MVEGDLLAVISSAVRTDDYCGRSYWKWEAEIAQPILEGLGYRVIRWYTVDGDSFGPLVRGVVVNKEGVEETLTYG